MGASKKQADKRKRMLLVRLGLVLLGTALGLLCNYLPQEQQLWCKLASKILALFVGS